MTHATIKISGFDDEDQMQDDTLELLTEIRSTVDHDARLSTIPNQPGTRADGTILLGEIALAFVAGGAATATLEIFKAYFSKRKGAQISVSREDGSSFSVQADDLNKEQLDAMVGRLEAFLRDDG